MDQYRFRIVKYVYYSIQSLKKKGRKYIFKSFGSKCHPFGGMAHLWLHLNQIPSSVGSTLVRESVRVRVNGLK